MSDLKNIRFTYRYRDASNYKSHGSVIFENPDGLTLIEIEERLKNCFDEELYFIADRISIPEVFLYENDTFAEDDHYLHEFSSVKDTDEQATDEYKRTIKTFLEQVEAVSIKGWALPLFK